MPCYHLDSRLPRGKRLCKCLSDTLFSDGKLPSQPTRRAFGAPLGDVFAKPPPAPLTDRLLSFGTCLCYFFPSSRFYYDTPFFSVCQDAAKNFYENTERAAAFFAAAEFCPLRFFGHFPLIGRSMFGAEVVIASASRASTDAGFANPCMNPPRDVEETSPATIVSPTTIRFALTVSALSG